MTLLAEQPRKFPSLALLAPWRLAAPWRLERPGKLGRFPLTLASLASWRLEGREIRKIPL